MARLFISMLFTLLANVSWANDKLNTMQEQESNTDTTAVVYFGNGCFWCTEAVFQQVEGVKSVTSGYSGGHVDNPSYKDVCGGNTGHAECLKIEYDPTKVSYADLLEIFWGTHDPTTLNRQGNDVGTQYRSVIFYQDEAERKEAESYKNKLNESGAFEDPIVTTLEPFHSFFPAENYHQNYYNLNGAAPYCQFVVKPKVEKFKKVFKDKMKKTVQ